VGDDDQTLYAYRASDVRYILEFTKKYLAATVHALDRNYRSCPNTPSRATSQCSAHRARQGAEKRRDVIASLVRQGAASTAPA